MASKTVSLFFLTFFSLALSAIAQNVTNGNLRCYFCELENSLACTDTVDVTTLPVVECSSLKYPSRREEDEIRSITDQVLSKAVDGKFRGAPLITEMFQGNAVAERQLGYKYICLRVGLKSGDMRSTLRTCERLPLNVKDACDFITQKVDPKVQVDNCMACETDKCNSASLGFVSILMIISSLFCVFLRQL